MMRKLKKKVNTVKTRKERQKKVSAQTQIAIKTAKFLASIPCWIDYYTQRDEMENGNEDLFSTRDEMVKKSSKMESMPQQWLQGKQSCGKTKKEVGRRHQTIPQA